MDIYLNVKTVQTIEWESMEPHTAYTVYHLSDEIMKIASAWTLRDAVELFAKLYGFDRTRLKLRRPFLSQHSIQRLPV